MLPIGWLVSAAFEDWSSRRSRGECSGRATTPIWPPRNVRRRLVCSVRADQSRQPDAHARLAPANAPDTSSSDATHSLLRRTLRFERDPTEFDRVEITREFDSTRVSFVRGATRSTNRHRENLAKRESRESTRPGSRMTSANGYGDRWCSIVEKADSLIL